MPSVIIAGIGTDVGKTTVSCILAQALGWDYWKPFQTGSKDSEIVQALVTVPIHIHREAYHFEKPLSPYHAAQESRLQIDLEALHSPPSTHLIIEGCGGLMNPLTQDTTFLDHFATYNLPWILVSRHYFGSLNHTLLSLAALKNLNQNILGIICVGVDREKEHFFEKKIPLIASMPLEPFIDPLTIQKYAKQWKPNLQKIL